MEEKKEEKKTEVEILAEALRKIGYEIVEHKRPTDWLVNLTLSKIK